MKKIQSLVLVIMILLVIIFLLPQPGQAQFQDAIEQLNSANVTGYLQPFVNAFGNNLNAGIYRSAEVSRVGLHIYLGVIGMATVIPDEDKTYLALPPNPFPQTEVTTATVFGENGATVSGAGGVSFTFPDGQVQSKMLPLAVPQIEVGSILGTMAKIRFFSGKLSGNQVDNLGEIKLVGYGLQHSLSQYFFMFPIDVSLGFFYQKLDVGDIVSTKSLSIGLQASKSFSILTLYGAVARESAKMNVSYTYQGAGTTEEINMDLESGSHMRMTVGACLKLGFLVINGDYVLGKQNTAAVGLGIGL